jgi:hypothetical protein
MSAFDHYRTKFQQTKEGTKEAEQENLKRAISQDFTRKATFRLGIQVSPTGEESQIRLQTTRKRGFKSEFLVHPEDILTPGNLVKDLSGKEWIVEEVVDIGEVMLKATLYQSNFTLKWMLKPGEEIETPIRVMAKTQLDALDQEKYLYLPSDMKILLLPLDEKTKSIKRQKRLMIDGLPYKVVKDEKFDYEGCLTLTVEETQKGEWDSEEVCDYHKPVEPTPPPQPTTYITGPTTILRNFSEKYYLFVGTTQVITGAIWTINNPLFSLSVKDGVATVEAPKDTKHIGEEVIINCQYFGVDRQIVATCKSLI